MKNLKSLLTALAASSLLLSLGVAGENKDSSCCQDCKDCGHCCATEKAASSETATSDKADTADAKTQTPAAKN